MGLFLDTLYNSPHYKVRIDGPYLIEGYLSQPIALATTAEWNDISQAKGGLMNVGAQLAGRSMIAKEFSYQVWQGSKPPSIALSISKVAVRSASGEVLDPTKSILKWNLPPDGSNPLKPPVPSLKGTGLITVGVGKWLRIPKLLPVSSTVNYSKEIEKDEHCPIRYDAQLTFQCSSVITAQDLDTWFLK